MARVLRHQPERIGLVLDPGGWVAVDELARALSTPGQPVTRAMIDEVVARNDKQRYAFDPTGSRIRASQGHTVPVELGLSALQPPTVLYHGTVARFLASILREGLRPVARHHVHLSADEDTARIVGSRRGAVIVLVVASGAMAEAGFTFYRSANGVWLTDVVPPDYLTLG